MGNWETNASNCRCFVKRVGCICLTADYNSSPGYPFPTAPNDVWDTVRWGRGHAYDHRTKLRKGFILEGTSAEANLAAVAALQARDIKLSPALTRIDLLNPFLLSHEVVLEKYKELYKPMSSAVVPQSCLE